MFLMNFQFFEIRLMPGIARHHSYIQNNHSGRPRPDEDDFEKISTLFLETPKRIHPRIEVFKISIGAFGNHIKDLIIQSMGLLEKELAKLSHNTNGQAYSSSSSSSSFSFSSSSSSFSSSSSNSSSSAPPSHPPTPPPLPLDNRVLRSARGSLQCPTLGESTHPLSHLATEPPSH